MSQSPTAAKVTALIEGPIVSAGYTLWDVKFVKEGASWYLRIFIDKDGGVDINDCTDVSHLIDPIIDEADPINVSYYMEVCSPGLERELTKPEHFSKYIGSAVKVRLIRQRDGKKEYCGILSGYDGAITVKDGETEYRFEKNETVSVKLQDADL